LQYALKEKAEIFSPQGGYFVSASANVSRYGIDFSGAGSHLLLQLFYLAFQILNSLRTERW
jgi:hypothetical protein